MLHLQVTIVFISRNRVIFLCESQHRSVVKKLTLHSKNVLEEKQEMGLQLPEEMRLLSAGLLVPCLTSFCRFGLGFLFKRRSRMVPIRRLAAEEREKDVRDLVGRSAQCLSGTDGQLLAMITAWCLRGDWCCRQKN